MHEQDPNAESAKRTLSEISHLFLSDVRDRHTGGAPRPQRVAPGLRQPPEPLDPAAARHNAEAPSSGRPIPLVVNGNLASAAPAVAPAPPITAVIAAHFGSENSLRVRQYARHLAGRTGRIGLIEIDASDVRISCFESDPDDTGAGLALDDAGFPESAVDDLRALAQAIGELDWDVTHWLVSALDLRAAEVRKLLADIRHWVLLSTCDHDGVVSSYRALKGLSDAVGDTRPLLTLSLLEAASETEADRVFAKLAGVCQQFLDWPVQTEPAVVPAPGVTEGPAFSFHASGAAGPWPVLTDLVTRANRVDSEPAVPCRDARQEISVDAADPTPGPFTAHAAPTNRGPAAQPVVATGPFPPAEEFVMAEHPSTTPKLAPSSTIPGQGGARLSLDPSEVLEINAEASAEAILAAILSRPECGLVECPVRAPMCPSARLTIDRDRRVILLAVAREGLADLRSIGQAYRWLIENRALIGMAVPQLAIDAHQFPRLRLLVDPADAAADTLQPMLQSGHVTVQAYRRIRWGDRTGLLLDAA